MALRSDKTLDTQFQKDEVSRTLGAQQFQQMVNSSLTNQNVPGSILNLAGDKDTQLNNAVGSPHTRTHPTPPPSPPSHKCSAGAKWLARLIMLKCHSSHTAFL